ncbi:MAG: CopG family transcriptional regulator [Solirubrobacterales bacterium]
MALVRTQISLPPGLHRKAKRRAAEEGVSLSELARRALAREVGQGERPERPKGDISAVFGLFSSGRSDVSENVDKYVGEAVRRDYERKMGRLSKKDLDRPHED